MEIIEKQVEKVREVPYGDCGYGYGYGYGRDTRNRANAGLTLGIIGTVLGGAALFGRRGGTSLLGSTGLTSGGGSDANIAVAMCGGGNGVNQPTAFQAWEKECDDALALTNGMWALKVDGMNNAREAREVDVNEKFQLWKSQIDADHSLYRSQIEADFGLYKSTRDAFDALTATHNKDTFALYKAQRDANDEIRKELCDLKAQVAINAAIRPYQDKLIQCEIDRAATAGINYTDRKTCNVIYGEVVLPNTPTVTGYVGANQCGCPRVVASTAATA